MTRDGRYNSRWMMMVPSVVGGVPREEGGIERTERPALAVAARASTRVRTRARWSVMISTVAPGVVVESVKGGYEMSVTGRASTSHEPASNCQMTSLHRPATSAAHLNTRDVSRYMSAILRNVLLLQRNVPAAAEFYQQGLGLIVTKCTESYAELGDGLDEQGKPVDPHDAKARPRTVLALKAVGTEAFLTTGYSPFLNFTVQDMDTTVNNMLRMGAVLDGPIKYPAQGKVAAMRVPDGHMIGLYEMSDSPFAGGNVMMDMDKMEDLKKGGTD